MLIVTSFFSSWWYYPIAVFDGNKVSSTVKNYGNGVANSDIILCL